MKKLLLLTSAFLALQSIPVLAEEGANAPGGDKGKPPHDFFMEQDANKDGFISKSEFLKMGEKKFAEIDANKDGKITPEEQKAHREKMRGKMKEYRKKMQEHRGDRPDGDRPDGEKAPE